MVTLLICEVVQKKTIIALQTSGGRDLPVHLVTIFWYQFDSVSHIRQRHDTTTPVPFAMLIYRVCALHCPHRQFRAIIGVSDKVEELDVEERIGKECWQNQVRSLWNPWPKNEANLRNTAG
jgi:hypothetical protein